MRKRLSKKFTNKDILFGLFILVITVGGYLFSPYVTVDNIRSFVFGFGDYGPLVIVLAQIITAVFAPLPNSAVTIVAGMIYGTTGGALYSLGGGIIGALVTYQLAKSLGRDFVMKLLTKKELGIVDKFFEHHGFKTIFLMRFLPTISFDAVSYAAGLTKMKKTPFVTATLLGMIPSTLIYAYLGEQITNTQVFILVIILVAIAGLPFAANVFREKKPRLKQRIKKLREKFRSKWKARFKRHIIRH